MHWEDLHMVLSGSASGVAGPVANLPDPVQKDDYEIDDHQDDRRHFGDAGMAQINDVRRIRATTIDGAIVRDFVTVLGGTELGFEDVHSSVASSSRLGTRCFGTRATTSCRATFERGSPCTPCPRTTPRRQGL